MTGIILSCLLCAGPVLPGSENLLPPSVSALDDPTALDGVRYLQAGPDFPGNPAKYLRILSSGACTGKGCLEFTSYNPAHGAVLFPGVGNPSEAGRTLTASAYVRAPRQTRLQIVIWTDDGELHPVEQIQETVEIGPVWRQIFVSGTLTEPCARASVLLRVSPIDMETRYTVQVDEVCLETGRRVTTGLGASLPGEAPSLESYFHEIRHVVPRTDSPPVLDGVIEPAEWDATPVLSGFTVPDTEGHPAPRATRVRMQYDADRLYVAAWCEAPALETGPQTSPAGDRPKGNDDRLEFFFNVLSVPHDPTFHLSLDAGGVISGEYLGTAAPWKPELVVASGRTTGAWTLEFSLPFADLGISDPQNTVWRLNIGRRHRHASQVSSQLACHETSFNEPACFENMIFQGVSGISDIRVVLLSRGELSPFGNQSGGNMALFWIENGQNTPLDLVFSVVNSVPGTMADHHDFSKSISAGTELVQVPYRVLGKDEESLSLIVTAPSGSETALFSSTCRVDRLHPCRVVHPVADPLYTELPAGENARPERVRWHMTGEMPLSGITYQSAIQFGCANSYTGMCRTLTEARLHVLCPYVPELSCVRADWRDRVASRWNPDFELLVAGARDRGLAGPILQANDTIIGVDEEGREGTQFGETGFLPDPINRHAFVQTVRATLEAFGSSIHAVSVGGEQFAHQWQALEKYLAETSEDQCTNTFLIAADRAVRGNFGFGKYGFPWGGDIQDPEYPFRRRATLAWLLAQLHDTNVELAGEIRRVAPEMIIVGETGNHGTTLSLETQHDYARVVTAQLRHERPHDYLYEVKQMRDLSGLSEIMPVPHDLDAGFPHGNLQTDELLELYSQMLRGGATGFHFQPAAYGASSPVPPYMGCVSQGHPLAWDMMLRVSALVNAMPDIRFPSDCRTALFVSRNTRLCTGQTGTAGDYALFELLGPEKRGWFRFVSDAQIALGTCELSRYRLLLVPEARYADAATTDAFLAFCRAGGILVSADPNIFEWNIDGTRLADCRRELFGIELGPPRSLGGDISFTAESEMGEGLVLPGQETLTAPMVTSVDDGVVVHALFADGSPAIVEKKHGTGRAVYAGIPFCNAELLADPLWQNWVMKFYLGAGGSLGHDIWRFALPESVVPEPKPRPAGRCLTGNDAFWYQYRLVRGAANVNTGGSYTIATGRLKRTSAFASGRLTDRLRLVNEPELAVAPKGYPGYLEFKPEPWVELVAGGEPTVITFDLNDSYALSRSELFYEGTLNALVADVSQDGQHWVPAAARTMIPPTGFREIGQVSLQFTSSPSARYLRWTLVPGDQAGDLVLVEAEVWAE